jgi:hypothetical protein
MKIRNKYRHVFIMLFGYFFLTAVHATGMTVESLKKNGVTAMKDAEIKALIVGNIIVVRNTETLANFAARFDQNGKRVLQRVAALKDGPKIIYQTLGDAKDANVATYEIKNNKLITKFDGKSFEVLIFKVKDTYYGARSTDNGDVNWELVLITKQ